MNLLKHLRTRSRQDQMILAAIAVFTIIGIVAVAVGLSMRAPAPPPLPKNANNNQSLSTENTSKSNKSSVDIKGLASLGYSKPTSIRIPAIDLPATKLLHYGQNPDGTVRVPLGEQTNKPAWYKKGPAPGQVGPAMLMGHVADENNNPSIFFRLSALRAGDKVYVPREDGKTAIFTITKIESFDKEKFPTDMVYGPTDHSAIRLVTCGGLGGNTQLGNYSQNVIAFGKLTGSKPSR